MICASAMCNLSVALSQSPRECQGNVMYTCRICVARRFRSTLRPHVVPWSTPRRRGVAFGVFAPPPTTPIVERLVAPVSETEDAPSPVGARNDRSQVGGH